MTDPGLAALPLCCEHATCRVVVRGYANGMVAGYLDRIAAEIAGAVPLGFEMGHDGREDPARAGYVEGLRHAHAIVSAARPPEPYSPN